MYNHRCGVSLRRRFKRLDPRSLGDIPRRWTWPVTAGYASQGLFGLTARGSNHCMIVTVPTTLATSPQGSERQGHYTRLPTSDCCGLAGLACKLPNKVCKGRIGTGRIANACGRTNVWGTAKQSRKWIQLRRMRGGVRQASVSASIRDWWRPSHCTSKRGGGAIKDAPARVVVARVSIGIGRRVVATHVVETAVVARNSVPKRTQRLHGLSLDLNAPPGFHEWITVFAQRLRLRGA